jgi:hypothetical protein
MVHHALRDWHKPRLDDQPWRACVSLAPNSTHKGAWSGSEWSQAIKKWIMIGLQELQAEDSSAADLLRQRFLEGEPVRVVAGRWNVSQSLVLQRQRGAIVALARCLWREEAETLAERQRHILDRLEITAPVHLFGVSDKRADLLNLLDGPGSPWIIAVDGMGGIGKTTLADSIARHFAAQPRYVDVGWVSARRSLFTLWGGLEQAERPALTYERLIDALLCQFDTEEATRLPLKRKLAGLKQRLCTEPYLVVIDNLETAADYKTFVPPLHGLCDPSRFLLTTRHSLRDFPGVYSLTLDELSLTDSLDLLRHEAQERGFHALADAPDDLLGQVYQAVGGNPLALKLVVGQSFALSLPEVLKNLRLAQGQAAQELYRHLYWHGWQALSEPAREVLVTMPLVAEQGGDIAQIAAISELPEGTVSEALGELVSASLVNRVGGIQSRRFAIHQLTESFLAREVLRWQSAP